MVLISNMPVQNILGVKTVICKSSVCSLNSVPNLIRGAGTVEVDWQGDINGIVNQIKNWGMTPMPHRTSIFSGDTVIFPYLNDVIVFKVLRVE